MKNLLTKLPKIKLSPKIYKSLPETSGVYLFICNNTIIYIGKATNLRQRVYSYFNINLERKTFSLMKEANLLSFIQVNSEFEALLLEAKLIREFQPKYNIVAKDDKQPLYIAITKDIYPRIITLRKSELTKIKYSSSYGPFTSGKSVKGLLRLIRKSFPYSDHKIGKRSCIYSQIGLCNPCPNNIEKENDINKKFIFKKIYIKNIKRINKIFEGNITKVINELEKEMNVFSKNKLYEDAATKRNQINDLRYITSSHFSSDSYIKNPNLYEDIRDKEIKELKSILRINNLTIQKLERIECFDVAHLYGTNATASMVTFIKGEPDKAMYRHFKIKQENGMNDYASLKEVIIRRRKHYSDWGKPDLIIVDGGKGQLSTLIRLLEKDNIPVIGLAKRLETLVIPTYSNGMLKLKEYRLDVGDALNLVQKMRNEAHRFARTYHHKLVIKSLIET